MINSNNKPLNNEAIIEDFTTEHYCELVRLAQLNYQFVSYENPPFGERFVLWRHDCDYSLNAAFKLAEIEAQEGVSSTFFINPHCEFYNIFEKEQTKLLERILELDHSLGLHFDAGYYETNSEAELEDQIANEKLLVERLVGSKLFSFSFHNPSQKLLSYEKDSYGGLMNCYSKRLKKEVAYCSDSNGYWRFKRLHDALLEASDSCLQVLTHPGWWQEKPMPPRQRIFHSVYGRASAVMKHYDLGLERHGRLNHVGDASSLTFLKTIEPSFHHCCDYLWNQEYYRTLYIELWYFYQCQINRLCEIKLNKDWSISLSDFYEFLSNELQRRNASELFEVIFNQKISELDGVNDKT